MKKENSFVFQLILAAVMTYSLNFLLSQRIYEDMDLVLNNVYNDASTELSNIPIAPHNDRYFVLMKTELNYDDFRDFVASNDELQSARNESTKIIQENILSESIVRSDLRHMLSLYISDKIRYTG